MTGCAIQRNPRNPRKLVQNEFYKRDICSFRHVVNVFGMRKLYQRGEFIISHIFTLTLT